MENMKLSESCLFNYLIMIWIMPRPFILIIDAKVFRIGAKDKFLGQITHYLNEFKIFYKKSFLIILYNFNFSHIILEYNNMILKYYFLNLNIYRQKGLSLMDTRLLVIAVPLLVAASWALYNIGRLAIQQVQRLSR